MASFADTLSSIGIQLKGIAEKFRQADQEGPPVQASKSVAHKTPTSSHASQSEGDNIVGALDEGFQWRDNLEKIATASYSTFALGLLATKTVTFSAKNGNKARAVIHVASWVKGKGPDSILKSMAKSMNKSILHPGILMRTLKGMDTILSKFGLTFGLNISKARNFPHWVKNVIAGVEDYRSGIRTSKIPGMVAKRLFPINAAFNIGQEGLGLYKKYQEGSLNGEEVAVAATNVVVKSAATYGGAVIGGMIGSIAGPPGAAAVAFIGGTVGAYVGDQLAKVAEKGARWAFSLFQ